MRPTGPVGAGSEDALWRMRDRWNPVDMNRVSVWGGLVLGLILAALVCTDPLLSHLINISYLEKYPFLLTACVAFLGFLAWLAAIRARTIWEHQDVWLFIMPIVLTSQLVGLSLGKIDAMEMTLAPLLPLWLAATLVGTQYPIRANVTLMLILGVVAFAFLSAINEPLGVFIHALLALLVKVVAFFLLSQFVRTIALVRSAIRVMIGVGVFAALAGIAQVGLYMTTNILLTCVIDKTQYFKNTPWGEMLRASGFSPRPQHLSSFLVVVLPVLLFVTFLPGTTPRRTWLGLLGVLIVCTGITLTLSVTGWIAMFLEILLFPYFRWPSRSIHFTAILTGSAVLCYVSGLFQWLYRNYLQHSGLFKGEGQRWYLLTLALEELHRSPLIGVGLRNFENFTKNFRRLPVHNAYFQAASEIGVLGGFCFLAILLYALIRLLYLNTYIPDMNEKLLIRVLLLGLIALMVSGLAEPNFDHSNTWVYLGILDGAIMTFMLRLREGRAARDVIPAGGAA